MSNTDLANRLLKLKKEIQDSKDEKIRLEAKLETAMEGLDGMTLPEAKKKLQEMEKEIKALQEEIEEAENELEEKYSI